ncbi:hypothetical protein C9374_005729 [Naegleria lovaniensis]|uniref:histidine kinase n=1 Tax=Naegleria lovaniensis TaxID=51637 RepID=A0AA88GPD0_NAELO|nr:uncharacterized protein C9374_005729 [Naegleria lovaniensis]KAG2381937.1 hypothetical protein C9374_005729 [Naegleria lovaniensis]
MPGATFSSNVEGTNLSGKQPLFELKDMSTPPVTPNPTITSSSQSKREELSSSHTNSIHNPSAITTAVEIQHEREPTSRDTQIHNQNTTTHSSMNHTNRNNQQEQTTIQNTTANQQQTVINVPPSSTAFPGNIVEAAHEEDDDGSNSVALKHSSRVRRFLSLIYTKSSSFLLGYRFVNFPGLRAHNSIKDPYERLSIAYYSVYFVFHLFFSISMIIQQLIRFKTLSLLYILDATFSLIGFILFRSPFPHVYLYVFLAYLFSVPYVLINLASSSIDTNSILSLLIFQQNDFVPYHHLILATNLRLIIFPTIFAAIGLSSTKTLIVAIIGYILAFIQFGWLGGIMQGLKLNYGDYFCDILFISIPYIVAILILNNMHQAFRSQIKEVETRLSNMLNITNEAIIIQSRRKKKIIYVNLAFERMFGYEHDEIVHANKNILDLLVGPPVIATDEWTLCKARTKLGDRFGVEVTHKVDFLSSKKVDVFIVRNNELNDQVRLMNEKARQAQIELQSRTTFFSMISHDLKNPLNSIYLIAQKMHEDFMSQQTVDFHEGLEWMNMILSSCHILSNIIQDVLSSSKLESGTVELDLSNFDLVYSIEEIISINSVTAFKKGIDVGLEIDIKRGSKHRVPIVVKGDVHKFQQILTNLMGNAIKFTHSGSVTVSVDVQDETDNTVKVFVVVCDTGIGIPKEKQKDLFKVFSRLKKDKEYEGSGLGLSICKNLTNLMNGDIGCYSNGESGSNFWFTVTFQKGSRGEDHDKIVERAEKRLPLTEEAKLMEVKEKLNSNYPSSTCLVVYKEPKIRNILTNYLRETFDDQVVSMENDVDTMFMNAESLENVTEKFLHNSSSNIHEWSVQKPISFIILDDSCFLPDNLPKNENALFNSAQNTNSIRVGSSSSTGRRNSSVIYSPSEIERIYSTVYKLRRIVENHNSKLALGGFSLSTKVVVWFDKFEPKRFLSFIRKDPSNFERKSNTKGLFDLTLRKPITLFSFQYMIQQLLAIKPSTIAHNERKLIETYQFPPKQDANTNHRKLSMDPTVITSSGVNPSQDSRSSSLDTISIARSSFSQDKSTPEEEKFVTLNVLVADDNNINRNVMIKILGGLSGNSDMENQISEIKNCPCKLVIRTKGAVNGKEAYDEFIQNFNTPTKYDAIILDVHMDVMSGLECSQKIRQFESEHKAKPCVLIGATGDSDGEHICKQAGMNLVCLKPISQTQIRNVVKHVVEEL